MTAQEKATHFAETAPELNQDERKKVNGLFPAYIFRKNKTGEVWTTCCGQHKVLEDKPGQRAIRYAMHQREARTMYDEAPRPLEDCPFCGRPVIVKELGRTGNRDNLCCWRRAMVLRWYRGALWGVCYDLRKDYGSLEHLTDEPKRYQMAVYRFRPGKAEMVRRSCCGQPYTGMIQQDFPMKGSKWAIDRPFFPNAYYGGGYDVIGLEEVEKSPFRYCQIQKAEKERMDIERYLTACCIYPRQIEMLMKAGLQDTVKDLVNRCVKHSTALDWETEEPKRFFKVDRQAQKAFLRSEDKSIEAVELYRKLKGKEPMETCCRWIKEGLQLWEVVEQARTWHTDPCKLVRYLERERRWGYQGTAAGAMRTWSDYLTAAAALGEPLHRDNVLMPSPLGPAHDSATDRRRNQVREEQRLRNERYRREEAEREKEREKQRKLAEEGYSKRKEALEKKYGYEAEGYVILVPENAKEITDEGVALKHCVGGYADRHIAGKTTILFMRRAGKPKEPWLTIEMNENHLVQIHGYRNEGLYTVKGRFAPDPRKAYQGFLDTWLEWIAAGSKRDRAGKPVVPNIKKEDRTA